jgi:hypothetical protein
VPDRACNILQSARSCRSYPFFKAPAAAPVTPVRRPTCTCGAAACDSKWHLLAMWIRDNPQEWLRLFKELEQSADKLFVPDVS